LDVAESWVSMFCDHKLYQGMMGREMNFRFSDLSSAFRSSRPFKYLRRLFQAGDEAVPARIERERPIQLLTTHNLLAYGEPIFSGLGKSALILEVVRHPLYMIKQITLNLENLPSNPRDIDVYFEQGDGQLPYFVYGWEELYFRSTPIERAIYSIKKWTNQMLLTQKICESRYDTRVITIPFEKYVLDPYPYMERIEKALDSSITAMTRKEMSRQKVPRKMIADGPALKLYKRCGWTPSQFENEADELVSRRQFAAQHADKAALEVLDRLSADYEKRFLSEKI